MVRMSGLTIGWDPRSGSPATYAASLRLAAPNVDTQPAYGGRGHEATASGGAGADPGRTDRVAS
jgi:hypothetical protein